MLRKSLRPRRIALSSQFSCDLAALVPTIRALTPPPNSGRNLALCFSKGAEAGFCVICGSALRATGKLLHISLLFVLTVPINAPGNYPLSGSEAKGGGHPL